MPTMMAKKCRCGSALYAIGKGDEVKLVCPDHGGDYQLSQDQVIALVAAVKARDEVVDHLLECEKCRSLVTLACDRGYKLDLWALGHQKTAMETLAALPKPKGETDES